MNYEFEKFEFEIDEQVELHGMWDSRGRGMVVKRWVNTAGHLIYLVEWGQSATRFSYVGVSLRHISPLIQLAEAAE